MQDTDGWRLIKKELKEELSRTNSRILNGSVEKFAEERGFYRGLSYVFGYIETQKKKLEQLKRESN